MSSPRSMCACCAVLLVFASQVMVNQDVADAIEAGLFRIHAVASVDDALELLTGAPAGARDPDGHFPVGSFNAAVQARLTAFAEDARTFARAQD